MIVTHPSERYTGPVVTASGRRVWFVDGEAEATHLSPAERHSLEDAGFTVQSPRKAAKSDDGGDG